MCMIGVRFFLLECSLLPYYAKIIEIGAWLEYATASAVKQGGGGVNIIVLENNSMLCRNKSRRRRRRRRRRVNRLIYHDIMCVCIYPSVYIYLSMCMYISIMHHIYLKQNISFLTLVGMNPHASPVYVLCAWQIFLEKKTELNTSSFFDWIRPASLPDTCALFQTFFFFEVDAPESPILLILFFCLSLHPLPPLYPVFHSSSSSSFTASALNKTPSSSFCE